MSTFARNRGSRRDNAVLAAAAASPSSSSSSPSSSTSSSAAASASSTDLKSTNETGNCTQKYLTNCKSLYSCIHCRTHLANHDELVSRSFQGNHGRAYLFNSVINISCGPAVQRQLNTGSHAVADIFCSNCERTLGWKYEKAYVETQKYKEGKYIIELAHVVRENRHLELDKGEIFLSRQLRGFRQYGKRANGTTIADRPLSSYSSSSSSSSSQLSSPADSGIGAGPPHLRHISRDHDDVNNDGDDEELMFPFYDDLCTSRSSYPGNLSMRHHNRARRSLYLESKPYDWDSSPLPPQQQQPASSSPASCSPRLMSVVVSSHDLAVPSPDDRLRSAIASCSSSSSSSEAASASPAAATSLQCCHADDDIGEDDTTTDDDDDRQDARQQRESKPEPVSSSSFKAIKRPKHNHNNSQDDNETQFKLEDDSLVLPPSPAERAEVAQFDRQRVSAATETNDSGQALVLSSAHQARVDDEQPSVGGNAINLDDEEFYDCYSEHDVLGSPSIGWPDPSEPSYNS